MKEYSVKEVCNYTGLTRKQLFDYKKSIKPINTKVVKVKENRSKTGKFYVYTDAKKYNQEGLEKLSMAAMLSELGARPKEINEIFSADYFDKNAVLDDLISKAEDKIQRYTEIIKKAKQLKILNLSRVHTNIFRTNEILPRESLEACERIFGDFFSGEEEDEDGWDTETERRLLDIIHKIGRVDFHGISNMDDLYEPVRELKMLLKGDGEEITNKTLLYLVMALMGLEPLMKDIDMKTEEGISYKCGNNLMAFLISGFMNRYYDIAPSVQRIVEEGGDEQQIKKYALATLKLFDIWFGIKSVDDVLGMAKMFQHNEWVEVEEEDEAYEDYKRGISCMIELLTRYKNEFSSE